MKKKTGAAPWRKAQGFTLIETLTVIAILGILTALGLPSFNNVVHRYKIERAADDLKSTLFWTRTEAIRRGGRIVLAKTKNPDCPHHQENQEWGCGWIVFIDHNGDGRLNGNDQLLQNSSMPNGISIRQTHGSSLIRVDRWGEFSGNSTLGFVIQSTGKDYSITLCMGAGGRIRTIKNATRCAA